VLTVCFFLSFHLTSLEAKDNGHYDLVQVMERIWKSHQKQLGSAWLSLAGESSKLAVKTCRKWYKSSNNRLTANIRDGKRDSKGTK